MFTLLTIMECYLERIYGSNTIINAINFKSFKNKRKLIIAISLKRMYSTNRINNISFQELFLLILVQTLVKNLKILLTYTKDITSN